MIRGILQKLMWWLQNKVEKRFRKERRCLICGLKFEEELYYSKWATCLKHGEDLDAISEGYDLLKKRL